MRAISCLTGLRLVLSNVLVHGITDVPLAYANVRDIMAPAADRQMMMEEAVCAREEGPKTS